MSEEIEKKCINCKYFRENGNILFYGYCLGCVDDSGDEDQDLPLFEPIEEENP